MNASFFTEYLEKWFAPIVQKVTELINGKKEEQTLFHKTMLTEEFSPDLKWGGKEINGSIVAADVVSLESTLPLKKRDSLRTASGDIPKLGLKLRKGEKALQDIQTMIAKGMSEEQIAKKIFDDIPKVVKGIDVRKEIMFLQALSTGVTLIEDDQNTGVGIRTDFGYKADNIFRSKLPWGSTGYVPQDDIEEVLDKAQADGNRVTVMMISKKYFNLMKNSTQGKVIAANFNNFIYTTTANLPVPSRAGFLAALEDLYSVKVVIVDSTFRVEKDGVQSNITPWEDGNVAFLYDNVVGRLVYGTLAEKTFPVPGVVYQDGAQGTLVSKYSKNEPLEEFTAGQALAIPVIDGVNSIYLLQADKQAIALTPDALTFTKAANTTGKTAVVTTDAASVVSAAPVAADTWCTVTVSGKVVTVKVAANSEVAAPERTTSVTITDSLGDTAVLTVTQAANV